VRYSKSWLPEDSSYYNVYRRMVSMDLKKIEQYSCMTAARQREEIKKWIGSELDDARANLQSLVGLNPEDDSEVETALCTPLNELPTLINQYDEDSMAHKVIKKRLADSIPEDDIYVLIDGEWGAERMQESIQTRLSKEGFYNNRDSDTLHANYYHITNLMELATILGDEDLYKKVATWLPPLP
jgi:hypothetical protein